MINHRAAIHHHNLAMLLTRTQMALLLNTKPTDLHMITVVKLLLILNKLWVESVPLQMMTLTTRPLIPLSHRTQALDHELTSPEATVAVMDTTILIQPTLRPSPPPLRR